MADFEVKQLRSILVCPAQTCQNMSPGNSFSLSLCHCLSLLKLIDRDFIFPFMGSLQTHINSTLSLKKANPLV